MPIIPGIMASEISGHLYVSSFYSIATFSGASGGSWNVTNIPQTFTHLQLRFFQRETGTGGATGGLKGVFININGDSTTTCYNHSIYTEGTTSYQSYSTDTRINFSGIQPVPSSSAIANAYGVMIMDILDYTNTNKYKVHRTFAGADLNGAGQVGMATGLYPSLNAITSLNIGSNESFTSATSIALYGVI